MQEKPLKVGLHIETVYFEKHSVIINEKNLFMCRLERVGNGYLCILRRNRMKYLHLKIL